MLSRSIVQNCDQPIYRYSLYFLRDYDFFYTTTPFHIVPTFIAHTHSYSTHSQSHSM